ncbi:ABC-type glycerol-3-phosphate transport system substrate-binding protein [Deinococcus metalli]|uniref:ABC transporter substrate-binding protein n=1 Tax=Deinococcus metalli TaxID=1141878 RepID=A0A7W8KHQ3_9DEIO|nr:extracellular solute-binding protein [Deinococcus metalli]MBB5377998.1 ABC-type glycerol-3-phosphate transport system substrate-binding protein [Deinococcus metalli]GHF53676.1 ABC transporter substrate-binding protein [Deinococcus metalli]
MSISPRPTLLLTLALAALGNAAAQATTPNPALKATISVWAWKDPIAGLKAADAAFTKAYPNIKVEYVQKDPSGGAIYNAYKLAFSAGSGGPDVALIEDSYLPQFVKLGALADPSTQVRPYAVNLNRAKLQAASLGGRTYAMPWDIGPVVLYYRRDVFKAAGVNPATLRTWDDYVKAAAVIKAKTGVDMLPLSRAKNDARLFETLLWQQGSGYVDASGAVSLDKDPRATNAMTLLNTLYKSGAATDLESWTDPWYKAIADGKVATLPMATWMGGFLKSWIAPKSTGQWGVLPLPTFAGTASRTSNDGGSQLAVWGGSRNKDAAWAYIQFHLAQRDAALGLYQKTDFFPALTTLYRDPVFSQADAYFGGQKVGQVYTALAKTIPNATVYTSDYADMNAITTIEVQKMALGKQDVATTLKNAADVIRSRTRRP